MSKVLSCKMILRIVTIAAVLTIALLSAQADQPNQAFITNDEAKALVEPTCKEVYASDSCPDKSIPFLPVMTAKKFSLKPSDSINCMSKDKAKCGSAEACLFCDYEAFTITDEMRNGTDKKVIETAIKQMGGGICLPKVMIPDTKSCQAHYWNAVYPRAKGTVIVPAPNVFASCLTYSYNTDQSKCDASKDSSGNECKKCDFRTKTAGGEINKHDLCIQKDLHAKDYCNALILLTGTSDVPTTTTTTTSSTGDATGYYQHIVGVPLRSLAVAIGSVFVWRTLGF